MVVSKMQENNFRQRAWPYIPINKFRGFTATFGKIETISKNTYMRWDGDNIEDLLSFLNINVSYKVTDDDDLIKSCKYNSVELKKGDFVVKEKNDFYIINFED